MFMNESVEESFYLWHSDITSAARHYLIWAYTQPSCFLSLSIAVALHYMMPIYGDHMPWAMRSLLKEQTFFGRMSLFTRSQECHRSETHNGRPAAWGLQWTHFRLISELFYTQRSRQGGNSPERANIWKIFCSSEQRRSLLGKSARAEVWEIHSTFVPPIILLLNWKT